MYLRQGARQECLSFYLTRPAATAKTGVDKVPATSCATRPDLLNIDWHHPFHATGCTTIAFSGLVGQASWQAPQPGQRSKSI